MSKVGILGIFTGEFFNIDQTQLFEDLGGLF